MAGLGNGPPCLRVDSEKILPTDERVQLARTAPGVTSVDSSEKGAPVRELIWPSVLGEPLVDCLQEPVLGEKSLEYAIQATASVWMPTWTLTLSGWHPGTQAEYTHVHVVSRFGL